MSWQLGNKEANRLRNCCTDLCAQKSCCGSIVNIMVLNGDDLPWTVTNYRGNDLPGHWWLTWTLTTYLGGDNLPGQWRWWRCCCCVYRVASLMKWGRLPTRVPTSASQSQLVLSVIRTVQFWLLPRTLFVISWCFTKNILAKKFCLAAQWKHTTFQCHIEPGDLGTDDV